MRTATERRARTRLAVQTTLPRLLLPFRHDWIVVLDADERTSTDLAVEIDCFVARAGTEFAMARVRRKDIFMGR